MRKFHIENEHLRWIKDFKFRPPSLKNFTVEQPDKLYRPSNIEMGISRHSIYSMNYNHSIRGLILGKTGSGKSWLLHSKIDRFARAGGCVFIVDVKGEYPTLSVPVQNKFKKFLLENEKPMSMNVKSFYPKYFSNFFEYTPIEEIEKHIDIDFTKIQPGDFMSLLGFVSKNEELLVQDIYNRIGKTINNIPNMIKYINNSGYQLSTKSNLLHKISLLEKNHVLGNNFPNILEDILVPGQVNILNLIGVDRLGKDLKIPGEFISLFLKHIIGYKEEGKMKGLKVLIIIDELSTWMEIESVIRELTKIVTKGRYFEISFIGSIQTKGKIPQYMDILFTQISHCFIPYNIDHNEFVEVYKRLMPTEYDYPITFRKNVSELYYNMKKHKSGSRDWMVIEVDDQNTEIFAPLSPLSWHSEEGDQPDQIIKKYFNDQAISSSPSSGNSS